MTGYFARLASRTGIGEAAPAAQVGPVDRLVTEDVVTFAAPPERSAMTLEHSDPLQAPAPDPVASTNLPVAAPAITQFEVPPRPNVARSDSRISEPPASADGAMDMHDAASAPTRPVSAEPSTATDFGLPERPYAAEAAASEATTRVARSAIAAQPAPVPSALRNLASPSTLEAAFRADASAVDIFEQVAASEPTRTTQAAEPVSDSQRPETPELRPGSQQPPRFIAPREGPAPRSGNGRSQSRPQAAPTVRIGHIQVDVHAAPVPRPQVQQPQPAPPAATASRSPSLRRFYLRDW